MGGAQETTRKLLRSFGGSAVDTKELIGGLSGLNYASPGIWLRLTRGLQGNGSRLEEMRLDDRD